MKLSTVTGTVSAGGDCAEAKPAQATDPSKAQVAETRLVLTDSRVKECSQLFRELWDVSRELRPVQTKR